MITTLLHTTAIAIVLAAGTGLALAQGTPGGQPGGQPGAGMAQSPGNETGSPADGTKAQPPGQAAGSQPATVGGAMSDEQVRTQLSAQGYMFGPGIWWCGLAVNLLGSAAQALQMAS